MIQDTGVQVLHEHGVVLFVAGILRCPVQDSGRIDSLRQGPVHPVVDHGNTSPVRSVAETRGAVRVPAVCDGAVIETAGRFDVRSRLARRCLDWSLARRCLDWSRLTRRLRKIL